MDTYLDLFSKPIGSASRSRRRTGGLSEDSRNELFNFSYIRDRSGNKSRASGAGFDDGASNVSSVTTVGGRRTRKSVVGQWADEEERSELGSVSEVATVTGGGPKKGKSRAVKPQKKTEATEEDQNNLDSIPVVVTVSGGGQKKGKKKSEPVPIQEPKKGRAKPATTSRKKKQPVKVLTDDEDELLKDSGSEVAKVTTARKGKQLQLTLSAKNKEQQQVQVVVGGEEAETTVIVPKRISKEKSPKKKPPVSQKDKRSKSVGRKDDNGRWAAETWDEWNEDKTVTVPPNELDRRSKSFGLKSEDVLAQLGLSVKPKPKESQTNLNVLRQQYSTVVNLEDSDSDSSSGELLDVGVDDDDEDIPGCTQPPVSSSEEEEEEPEMPKQTANLSKKRSRSNAAATVPMEEKENEPEYSSPPKRPSVERSPEKSQNFVFQKPLPPEQTSPVCTRSKAVAPRLLLNSLPEKTPQKTGQEEASSEELPVSVVPLAKLLPSASRPMPLCEKKRLIHSLGESPSSQVSPCIPCYIPLERCPVPQEISPPSGQVVKVEQPQLPLTPRSLESPAEDEEMVMAAEFWIDERTEDYAQLRNATPGNLLMLPENLTRNVAGCMELDKFPKNNNGGNGEDDKELAGIRRMGDEVDGGKFGAGFLEIEPRTVLPMELFPDRNLVYFVLQGKVTVKSAGGWYSRQADNEQRNYLVGRSFSNGACIVLRKNTLYTLENWEDQKAVLGYAEVYTEPEVGIDNVQQ